MWKNKAEGTPADETAQADGAETQPAPQSEQDVIAFVGKGVEFKGIIPYAGTVRT